MPGPDWLNLEPGGEVPAALLGPGDTWTTVRRHLDRLHAGTFTGLTGMFRQRTELSKPQQDLLARLDPPPEEDYRTRRHRPLNSGNTTT